MGTKSIIIFKTDRIGDFINFSPCLKIIKHNFKESEITVVCSKYNYQIVKNYEEIDKIVVLRTTIILDFFTMLKNFFPNKYDYLFQLDGNKRSYFLSCFISANIKSTIFFFKDLNIFNFKYKKIRPNFIIRSFYKNYILCNEDYDNFDDEEFHIFSENYILIGVEWFERLGERLNLINRDLFENLLYD